MLDVKPNPAIADQEIEITINSLHPGQQVTIKCVTKERKVLFISHALFVANLNGEVDTRVDGSFGGSYTGVSQMGIFWSMIPIDENGKPRGTRYIQLHVSKPAEFNLQVFDGHLTEDQVFKKEKNEALFEKTVYRTYMGPGVTRHPVKQGRLLGSVFKPGGKGPFKGVLDLFGGNGGIVESRAALLASRGFVAYALPYISHDSERTIYNLEVEYFLDALHYLQSLDYVQPGISAIGLSYGATVMLFLSTLQESGLKSVVAISGNHYVTLLNWKGKPYPPHEYDTLDLKREMTQDQHGAYRIDHYIYDVEATKPFTTPIERSPRNTKYLFVVGEDDQNLKASVCYRILRDRMVDHGREEDVSALVYPNVGHFIDPPYMPQTVLGYYFTLHKLTVSCGGEMVANAAACQHAWREILKFLEKNTGVASRL